jgi:hypothetical protein
MTQTPGWFISTIDEMRSAVPNHSTGTSERIEQAQILLIVHARNIFADRTAQRHYAQPLRPFVGKGLYRIVDL